MLEFMICIEKDILFVVSGEVKYKTLVDQIVIYFTSLNVHVLYQSLHNQVFLNLQKRQNNIFVSMVCLLEIHFVIKLILDNAR